MANSNDSQWGVYLTTTNLTLFKGNTYGAGNTNNRAWIWVGTQVETKEVVRIIGEKAMKEAGFQHANIIKCINGQRKSHKGYTWAKESWGNA